MPKSRWTFKLQAFDFHIDHRSGSQNVVFDTLFRMDINGKILINDHLLDLDLNSRYSLSEDCTHLKQCISVYNIV